MLRRKMDVDWLSTEVTDFKEVLSVKTTMYMINIIISAM